MSGGVGRTKIYKQDTINHMINIDPLSEYGRTATVSEIDRQEIGLRVFCPFLGVNRVGEKSERDRIVERESCK